MEELKEQKDKIRHQIVRIKRKLDELMERKNTLLDEYNTLKAQFMEIDRCLALVDGRCKVIAPKPREKKKVKMSARELFANLSPAERQELINTLLDLDEKVIS